MRTEVSADERKHYTVYKYKALHTVEINPENVVSHMKMVLIFYSKIVSNR